MQARCSAWAQVAGGTAARPRAALLPGFAPHNGPDHARPSKVRKGRNQGVDHPQNEHPSVRDAYEVLRYDRTRARLSSRPPSVPWRPYITLIRQAGRRDAWLS